MKSPSPAPPAPFPALPSANDPQPQAWNGALEFRALAETVPALVFACDPMGMNVYVNARFERYAGVTGEAMRARGYMQVVHPDDRAAMDAAAAAARASGDEYEVEARLCGGDGGYRWHMIRAAPMRRDGDVLRWMGVATDIEVAHTAAADAERAAALLAAIGDAVPDLIYARDRAGRFTYVSRAAALELGFDAATIVGRRTSEVIADPAEARQHVEHDSAVLEGGRPVAVEEAHTGPDGRRRAFRSVKAPLRDARGAVVGVAGITRDVTAERALTSGLADARAELRRFADAIPYPVWRADDMGRIEFRNAAWAAMGGGPAIGPADWSELVVAADLGDFLERWRYSVASGEPFEHVARLHDRPAGGARRFFVQAVREWHGDGVASWYGAIWPAH